MALFLSRMSHASASEAYSRRPRLRPAGVPPDGKPWIIAYPLIESRKPPLGEDAHRSQAGRLLSARIPPMTTKQQLVKLIALFFMLAAVIILFHILPVATWLRTFQTYVRSLGALGYVVYIVVYAACVVAFVPGSILTLGAGAIFGFVGGTIVVVIGATIGATLSFLLARTVMRKRIEAMTTTNAKFRALDHAIAAEGMKIVFLVRLAVVFPFTWINYAFGLTAIPLGRYVLATFVGILPATAAFVFVSSAATSAATTPASSVTKVVYIAGGVVAVIVSVLIGRIATKAIRRAGVEDQ
jgi:uncharacterized membrane protein YdjX (TVP38/TMEM64 family)